MELAHGKNIPRQNSPRTGPPTIPNIFKATWGSVILVTCYSLRLNWANLLIYQQNRVPHQVGKVGHGQTQDPVGHGLERRHTWQCQNNIQSPEFKVLESSPKALDSRVALDSVMRGKCGLMRSSIVTVASELKAEEMLLQQTQEKTTVNTIGINNETQTLVPICQHISYSLKIKTHTRKTHRKYDFCSFCEGKMKKRCTQTEHRRGKSFTWELHWINTRWTVQVVQEALGAYP